MIRIVGYDKLNEGQDGLRYAWGEKGHTPYLESAAFVNKTKNILGDVCGYTTSVSKGCVLSTLGLACKFCRTGNCLPFDGLLSECEIAKQNVFMVLTDIYCDKNPEIKSKKREFAYMGQGEPGFSYKQVRTAIEITNSVMKELGQTVYRHIFATCGVPSALRAYAEDVRSFFTERVTLHFSLHATRQRDMIMPINRAYPYQDSLKEIYKIYDICKEKPCIGILLLNDFQPNNAEDSYTNSIEEVILIAKELNPEKCRLSLCEFNPSPDIGKSAIYSSAEAEELLKTVQELGFEAKLFSSFGQREQTACGMLGGKEPTHYASDKWLELDKIATELVEKHAAMRGFTDER